MGTRTTTHTKLWRPVATTAWLSLGLFALLSIGCRQGVQVIDIAPKPLEASGTISGIVRGPDGTSSVEGRAVEAVNVATGERQRATTNAAGGFTFKVRPGKYRVQMALLTGETMVREPGEMNVNRSDADANAEFIVGNARPARPRPNIRIDNGLGSPIA